MDPPVPAADDWTALSVEAPPAGSEVYLVEALRRLGAGAIERDGPRYLALLPPAAISDDLLPDARAAVRAATGIASPDIRLVRIPHEEWARRWNANLRPLTVGGRFLIVPEGWKGDRAPHADGARIVLRLTAGTAFGTAEHPTTRSCLALLEELIVPGARILDLGAGSGLLSLGAAALGADPVLALEKEPDACRIARRNVELNGLSDRIEVRTVEVRPIEIRAVEVRPVEVRALETRREEARIAETRPDETRPGHAALRCIAGDPGDREPPPPLGPSTFDGVVANLEAPVLGPLLPGIGSLATPEGWILLSGIPEHEAHSIVERARPLGLREVTRRIEQGWWTGAFRRSLTTSRTSDVPSL
jgi:ribosomal protein L11 methyltransferase